VSLLPIFLGSIFFGRSLIDTILFSTTPWILIGVTFILEESPPPKELMEAFTGESE
jgi:hypothetical protein